MAFYTTLYFCHMAKRMLSLKEGTDPQWVTLVQKDLEEILTDHAWAEQKAASTAISIMVQFPEFSEVVTFAAEVAREELEHFQDVHRIILERGFILGRERKDKYVHDLMTFFKKGGRSREQMLVDRLLFAAMIEARSCERFRVLADHIDDEDLSNFYRRLMKSEAGHYSQFLLLAKNVGGKEAVDQQWKAFLDHEKEVISRYGKSAGIHG